jgi:hypothetical protein
LDLYGEAVKTLFQLGFLSMALVGVAGFSVNAALIIGGLFMVAALEFR